MLRFIILSILVIFQAAVLSNPVLTTLPAGSWYSAPDTRLRTEQQSVCSGFSIFETIMVAWSGGAYDPNGRRLLIWGGGLGNYMGNEIYAFRIDDLKWERLSDPYCGATGSCEEPFANNTPMTRHSYNQMAVIAHANRFFIHGGASNCQGTADMSITWTFDLASKQWHRMNPSGPRPSGQYMSNCAYDPHSKKVYYQNAWDGFFSYDYDANQWTRHNSISSDGETYGLTSTIDTKRRLFIEIGRGNVIVYDLNTPSLARSTWTTSGDVPGLTNVGLAYDETADRVVLWDGGSPYALNMDTKVWTRLSGSGAPTPTSQGMYGRWRYVPTVNAFVCATSVDQNVVFYKNTAGGGVRIGKNEGGRMKDESSIQVSPNPCRSFARIVVAGKGAGPSAGIAIFDLRGRRIAALSAASSGAAIWEAGRTPAGVYIARAEVGGKLVERTFLLVR